MSEGMKFRDFLKSSFASLTISVVFAIAGCVFEYCFGSGNVREWIKNHGAEVIVITGVLVTIIHLFWVYTKEVKMGIDVFNTDIKSQLKTQNEGIKTEIEAIQVKVNESNATLGEVIKERTNDENFSIHLANEGLSQMINSLENARVVYSTFFCEWPKDSLFSEYHISEYDKKVKQWREKLKDRLSNKQHTFRHLELHLEDNRNQVKKLMNEILYSLDLKSTSQYKPKISKIQYEPCFYNIAILFDSDPVKSTKAKIWWGGGGNGQDQKGEYWYYTSTSSKLIDDYMRRFDQLYQSHASHISSNVI